MGLLDPREWNSGKLYKHVRNTDVVHIDSRDVDNWEPYEHAQQEL